MTVVRASTGSGRVRSASGSKKSAAVGGENRSPHGFCERNRGNLHEKRRAGPFIGPALFRGAKAL
mgnify:CR=1 FL=1